MVIPTKQERDAEMEKFASCAADEFRRMQRPQHRRFAARQHRDIVPPRQVADAQGVQAGLRHRHIARNGGDPGDLEQGRAQRQQDRQRIVLPRIGVDQNAPCRCQSGPPLQVFEVALPLS